MILNRYQRLVAGTSVEPGSSTAVLFLLASGSVDSSQLHPYAVAIASPDQTLASRATLLQKLFVWQIKVRGFIATIGWSKIQSTSTANNCSKPSHYFLQHIAGEGSISLKATKVAGWFEKIVSLLWQIPIVTLLAFIVYFPKLHSILNF